MKKILILYGFMLLLAFNAGAQDCATGYCPDTLTVDHYAGDISPKTVRIEYKVVETDLSGTTACWITQNLGATAQASSEGDPSVTARGWFWQFNRKQGYAYDGTRTPSVLDWITSIDENSDWQTENDPCTLLLGGNWHIPTSTEWTNVQTNGGWGTSDINAYNGVLKLHRSGRLDATGAFGAQSWIFYNVANQASTTLRNLYQVDQGGIISNVNKAEAFPVRCVRTY